VKASIVVGALAACMLAGEAAAVEAQLWVQKDYADYERAKLTRLSLASDGRVSLAPVFRLLLDSPSAYLWALAEDARGNLYAGGGGPGGPGARVYLIPRQGAARVLAELDGLEVHALAVDGQGRLYAATSPDGRVYRIAAEGKAEVFYEPKAKYIWDLAFDRQGRLYVATGDRGEVHRVLPDGRGGIFYQTAETHARSLAVDRQDNLLIGTEPGGLIVRVDPLGRGFVLYQSGRREITAVAVAPDGCIYAAGVGARQPAAPAPPAPPPAPLPQPSPLPGTLAAPQQQARPAPAPAPAPPLTASAAQIAGGSEVYRIDREGFPRKIWSHAQDIVYALAFDPQGRPLIGAGNRGAIYRLDSESVWTALVNAPPTQVTRLLASRGGPIYAATGNLGQVYRLGPELEEEGTVESEPLDGGMFSYWGRLRFRATLNGGQILVSTRSGNLERPEQEWSQWSPPVTSAEGAPVSSPPARFLQWRATLRSGAGGVSPELRAVEVAWRARNVAPRLEQIEITPANYRTQPPALNLTPSQSITLPPLGRRTRPSAALSADSGSLTMQYAKGYRGARWAAFDDNGDELLYRIEIRGEREKQWKLLKDKVRDKHLSWDSTGFADGQYRLRVLASDAPDNPPEEALEAEAISEPFLIDNTPPEIAGLEAALEGGRIRLRFRARDALSPVVKAECSVNGGDWFVVQPKDRVSDSPLEEYEVRLPAPAGAELAVAVRVTDDYDNHAVATTLVGP